MNINGHGDPSGVGLSRRVRWVPLGLFLGLWATATGCVGGSSPPGPSAVKQTAAKVPATPSAVVENKAQAPTLPTPSPYAYNPEARRDPFRSILVASEMGKTLESLPPLLRTEVGELRLIGIVWGGMGNSAMVQTPDGKGYTIRAGTPVGPNNGTVRRITDRYLVIEEKYTDIFGEKKVREIKMELHPQKEGSE
ncbi:MAG: pilus assembly protein PilP [Nitrospirae bacterium]|nr:pilus assembly protein PilP [Nitrospirota bacterium]